MRSAHVFNDQLVESLLEQSRQAPRQRAHLNLHQSYHDPVQRFLIAMQPTSYVCPHYHPEPDKWELFTVVRGAFSFFIFGDDGTINERIELIAGHSNFGLELTSGQWHSVIARQTNSLFFEVKRGPYCASRDKLFAPWAPKEADLKAQDYRRWLVNAKSGERFM
ncbi:WbuC family cupin fold metalloprotein [Neiella sp. HB171785]|uniref:WbuC family cupin fold metalloprotein n=1 Tax=Neiella litorisoli TaxID=2771431 RepID=A0A8J6UHA2_9GAMM|nr:WbuC family cupin fold metalloprotein [Neiella litorisoli]MBD1391411.1 WbuC family cupin fold metalloprotein [Neiella litorisoli]